MELFIGNLPPNASEAYLQRLFYPFGDRRRFVLTERRLPNGRKIRCAYGIIIPDEGALRAIKSLHMRRVAGRTLLVLEHVRQRECKKPPLPRLERRNAERRSAARRGAERRARFGTKRPWYLEHRKGERRGHERRAGEKRMAPPRRQSERRTADRRFMDRRSDVPLDQIPLHEPRQRERRALERRGDDRRKGR